jgi:hypothetical protein
VTATTREPQRSICRGFHERDLSLFDSEGQRTVPPPNGRAFSGEPSEHSERPERMRRRRVRCNGVLGSSITSAISRLAFRRAPARRARRLRRLLFPQPRFRAVCTLRSNQTSPRRWRL